MVLGLAIGITAMQRLRAFSDCCWPTAFGQEQPLRNAPRTWRPSANGKYETGTGAANWRLVRCGVAMFAMPKNLA